MPSAASAANLFALTGANQILRVDDLAPGTPLATIAVTGLQSSETLVAIDFRPANDTLYGLSSSGRLYAIEIRTGAATAVTGADGITAGPLSPLPAGSSFGFDFNPTVDRIRLVSDADANLRLNPADGVTAVAADTNLSYAPGDPNVGANPNIIASAYTNSFNGASSTTLFGIDTGLDVLVTQNPPNNGTLNTVGALGVDATGGGGFDIAHNGPARVVLNVGGVSRLYLINLNTGVTLGLGAFAQNVVSIAIPPAGFSATLTGTDAVFTGSAASESIRFDSQGGLLRHDRFDAGDAGFASPFDFHTGVAGDQTLAAGATGAVTINTGFGDDLVTIGSPASPAGAIGPIQFLPNGGIGHDVVRIDDTASSTGRSYVLGGGIVNGIFGSLVASEIERTELVGGSGDDVFSVGLTSPVTTLRGGAGADRFEMLTTQGVNGGLLDGEAGVDTLDLANFSFAVTFEPVATRELYLAGVSSAQEPGPLSLSAAIGRVVATLSPDATALEFRIPYSSLLGNMINGAHFHAAKAGINGGIERGMVLSQDGDFSVPSGTFQGIWSSIDAEPLGATELAALRANRIYFNIHTTPSHTSGEIRGQLISQGPVGLATGTGGVRGIEVLDVTLFGDGFE